MTYKPGGGGESGHSESTKEYIITMGRIIKARNMLMADGYHNADVLDRVVNLLRSRPHTPAAPVTELSSKWCWEYPDCEKCKTSTMCSLCPCKKKCDDARKDEREQVLDAIWGYMTAHGIEKRPKGYYVVSGTFSLGTFIKYIESLRGGATEEGGERR